MRATRNFRLSRTQSVLVPPIVGRGLVAGEACTELGCEPLRDGDSWLERWLGIGRRGARSAERKSNGLEP